MFKDLNDNNFKFLQKRLEKPTIGNLLESSNASFGYTLNNQEIINRQKISKETLIAFVKNNLDNDKSLYPLIDRIILDGGDALRAISNNDIQYLNENWNKVEHLEIVIQTDGSRPSFLIKNGLVDMTSSPITDWGDMLNSRQSTLSYAINSVGRINAYGAGVGTGFLIAPNLIMTNRHVLEGIATLEGNEWKISLGSNIDFGHENRAIKTLNKSILKKVVFTGENAINRKLNHNNLDIAVIEIEDNNYNLQPLEFDLSPNWPEDELVIFTIGYPTSSEGYSFSLLDLLFKSQFGFKRLSPGRIQTENVQNLPNWTFSHDATTLGGNSGSVILALNNERVSAGIHYGGTKSPLSNWGHVIGAALETLYNEKSLRQILDTYGVKFYS
jgi:hypothetical protein